MRNLLFLFQSLESTGIRWGLPTPFFMLFPIMTAVAMGLTACREPAELTKTESGSLSLEINSSGFNGMRSLQPAAYLFSGIGPDGDTFSMTLSESSASVEALKTGEWDVWVKGLNTDGGVILFGESTMNVKSSEEAEVNIDLSPVEGFGSIHVTVEWPEKFTVDPSIVVTLTDSDGEASVYSLLPDGGGFAEEDISGIPTGNYRVAVQLFDSGVPVTGTAWTARVLDSLSVDVSAQFKELNKVGKKLEINEDSFTIAWDMDTGESVPDSYHLYFRHRGEESWTFLSTVEDGTVSEFTVTSNDLSYGTYEFAVTSVVGGVESAMHTSLDDTADPVSGWYIEWMGT